MNRGWGGEGGSVTFQFCFCLCLEVEASLSTNVGNYSVEIMLFRK